MISLGAKRNQFSTWHRQADYQVDQDQIERNNTQPTSDSAYLEGGNAVRIQNITYLAVRRSCGQFQMLVAVCTDNNHVFQAQTFSRNERCPLILLFAHLLFSQSPETKGAGKCRCCCTYRCLAGHHPHCQQYQPTRRLQSRGNRNAIAVTAVLWQREAKILSFFAPQIQQIMTSVREAEQLWLLVVARINLD